MPVLRVNNRHSPLAGRVGGFDDSNLRNQCPPAAALRRGAGNAVLQLGREPHTWTSIKETVDDQNSDEVSAARDIAIAPSPEGAAVSAGAVAGTGGPAGSVGRALPNASRAARWQQISGPELLVIRYSGQIS